MKSSKNDFMQIFLLASQVAEETYLRIDPSERRVADISLERKVNRYCIDNNIVGKSADRLQALSIEIFDRLCNLVNKSYDYGADTENEKSMFL